MTLGTGGARSMRTVVLLATSLLLAAHTVLAFELRVTAPLTIVRPDHQGYTSYWRWGPGGGLGLEGIPDGSDFGVALWTEFAELPGRSRGLYGDTVTVSPWDQTRVFVGLRAHLHPRHAPGLAITGDLATGRGVMDFGDVRVQRASIQAENVPASRQWGDIFTFGAGLELLGERFGAFADMRSEVFSPDGDVVHFFTWNTKRIGLIWRPWRPASSDD